MVMLEGEVTSLALCWQIERSDGAGVALTSHDRAVELGGVQFTSGPAITPAAITRSLGLDPHMAEVSGALSDAALNDADLSQGRWDGAAVQLSVADWADETETPLTLLTGKLGVVSVSDNGFSAELQGAAADLVKPVCPSTSPECRAEFGDSKCRVDLAGRTLRASVQGVVGNAITLNVDIDNGFVFGRLRYLSGANCGLSSLILSVSGNQVVLREAPPGGVEPGCPIELRQGCDKRFATCVSRFANAANFRGEPHLPGNDLLTRYPGA